MIHSKEIRFLCLYCVQFIIFGKLNQIRERRIDRSLGSLLLDQLLALSLSLVLYAQLPKLEYNMLGTLLHFFLFNTKLKITAKSINSF